MRVLLTAKAWLSSLPPNRDLTKFQSNFTSTPWPRFHVVLSRQADPAVRHFCEFGFVGTMRVKDTTV